MQRRVNAPRPCEVDTLLENHRDKGALNYAKGDDSERTLMRKGNNWDAVVSDVENCASGGGGQHVLMRGASSRTVLSTVPTCMDLENIAKGRVGHNVLMRKGSCRNILPEVPTCSGVENVAKGGIVQNVLMRMGSSSKSLSMELSCSDMESFARGAGGQRVLMRGASSRTVFSTVSACSDGNNAHNSSTLLGIAQAKNGSDLYKVLNIDEDALDAEVRSAYKQAMIGTTKCAGSSPSKVAIAFEVLGNQSSRRGYDAERRRAKKHELARHQEEEHFKWIQQEVERKRFQHEAQQHALKAMLGNALQQSRQQKVRREIGQRANSAPQRSFYVPRNANGCYHLFSNCSEIKQAVARTSVTEGRRLCPTCAREVAAMPSALYESSIAVSKPLQAALHRLPSLRRSDSVESVAATSTNPHSVSAASDCSAKCKRLSENPAPNRISTTSKSQIPDWGTQVE